MSNISNCNCSEKNLAFTIENKLKISTEYTSNMNQRKNETVVEKCKYLVV